MRVERLTLSLVALPLRSPFRTSHGEERVRRVILVQAVVDGVTGLGEVATLEAPFYDEEFTAGALLVLERYLGPALLGRSLAHPDEVGDALAFVQRHNAAKAGLEAALWDAWAKAAGMPLAEALGGEVRAVPVGVAVGMAASPEALVEQVASYLAEGYRRVKLKIAPGHDVAYVAAVRAAFPDAALTADANGSYHLEDAPLLARLDPLGLLMLEQPLPAEALEQTAMLRSRLRTPLCLDESVRSETDLRRAVALGAVDVLNLKAPRVGGESAARRIQAVAATLGVPVWCGGMLESGVGRAHNLALATLPGFTLPGDLSPSRRYWQEDIVEPELTMAPDGTMTPPKEPGIGVRLRHDLVRRFTEAVVEVQHP